MVRRKVNATDVNTAGPSWQRFYSDVYQRTSGLYQTRTGRRNRELTTFANLLGLNTAYDDLHKADGESPYLRNVRFMGDKQHTQRAQVTSRYGAGLLGQLERNEIPALAQETYIELWEGRAIEFDLDHSVQGMLVGGSLNIMNIEGAHSRLRVILRYKDERRPLCDANIDLEFLPSNRFVTRSFNFIQTPTLSKGVVVRLEIEGDSEPDECGNLPIGRKIRIAASGQGTHLSSDYTRPNVNDCLREVVYNWQTEPSIPCFAMFTASSIPIPSGYLLCTSDGKFLVFPVKTGGNITLYRFNVDTKVYTAIQANVDSRATAVRFEQGLGKLYYVDGYSPLQRIDLTTWVGELAVPDPSAIDVPGVPPSDLTAQPGASLIMKHQDRMVLSGFAEDPNFVQWSLINTIGNKTQYDQYSATSNTYVPDNAPKGSVCAPITALSQFENNIVVFRQDGCTVLEVMDDTHSQSEAIYNYTIGVERQEDVAVGNGTLYIWNRAEGFRRFSGAEATFQSYKVDNMMRAIPMESNRFMVCHANKVRFYCDIDANGVSDHCMLFFPILAASSPWYCDDNTPVTWAVADQTTDTLYAMHAQTCTVYIVDKPGQFTDFDSSIDMEYHTQHKAVGSAMGWDIIRRVGLRVIANATNTWFIGVDFNHEDRPAVWRRLVRKREDDEELPTGVFDNTAESGTQVINLFLRAKVRDFNVRVFVSNWRDNAMLQIIEAQIGIKEAL